MKVVIIGGVAGGATAAARLRRLEENAEIIILERSGFVSYANCGLPYYIGGVIQEKHNLTLQTPQSFWNRFHIQVRVRHEVISIDREQKKVRVRSLEDSREYEETYDKLILSPGAHAVKPDLPGIDSQKIFTLRTVEDTFRIRTYLECTRPKTAVIVGGGFIGLEMAENLIHSGIRTTLLQRSGQVMPPLDFDMACGVHSYLRNKGLDLRFHQSVVGYEDTDGKVRILLKDSDPLEADLVILAIGVVPETHLASAAGLTLGAKTSIVVNEHMQTSDPDIYAVGDAVEIPNYVTGKQSVIPLAGPANKQARIAADHICGRDSRFLGSQGSSILKLFDMTIASTGVNEKTANVEGIDCDKVVTFSASHATYYPGATNMTIKTIFEKSSGKVLGAQIVGFDGVDKRIDVLATAIHAGMTGEQLAELDLAYAPPYSSAKDPVNMAGFVIENIRSGLVKQFHWDEVDSLPDDGSIIRLDVRTKAEYDAGHIPGTVHIPVDVLRDNLHLLDRSKPIYVNCQSGLRSYIACRILSGSGYDCYNLSGGYRYYAQVMSDLKFDAAPKHPCGLNL